MKIRPPPGSQFWSVWLAYVCGTGFLADTLVRVSRWGSNPRPWVYQTHALTLLFLVNIPIIWLCIFDMVMYLRFWRHSAAARRVRLFDPWKLKFIFCTICFTASTLVRTSRSHRAYITNTSHDVMALLPVDPCRFQSSFLCLSSLIPCTNLQRKSQSLSSMGQPWSFGFAFLVSPISFWVSVLWLTDIHSSPLVAFSVSSKSLVSSRYRSASNFLQSSLTLLH
jgi:hypothetical protein